MKRIYASLALLGGVILNSNAQNVDLQAFVDMSESTCLKLGDTVQGDPASAQPYSIWYAVNNGPDIILPDEDVMYMDPRSEIGDSSLTFFTANSYNGENVLPDSLIFGVTGLAVDSIKSLLDIDAFEGSGTTFADILVPRSEFVNGATYGFYFYLRGIGSDFTPVNTDANLANNWAYVSIVWNDCATSLEDLFAGKNKVSLTAYPNPATSSVNFDYVFAKPSNVATVKVADLTGRTVISKDFGKVMPGKETFKLDVSSLVPGTYLIEFSTENERGVAKFTVSK